MPIAYLKKADPPERETVSVTDRVNEMLAHMEREGEFATRAYSSELDHWNPERMVLTSQEISQATQDLPAAVSDDIDFAHARIKRFAERQRASLQPFESELYPGLITGQRHIPVGVAGCYVPGGRYAHISSALMSIATAKAAGVPRVIACTPPRQGGGIPPATLYAMAQAGADTIMCLGGVQAIAAMAFGHFTGTPADVIAGPGNRFVTEAKRLLFGRVGIDMIAGPSEVLVIADQTADPRRVAADLISQAEHGPDSPTILVSTSRPLAQKVHAMIPEVIERLPTSNADWAQSAWAHHGEIVVTSTRGEAAKVADEYASEHVEVHATDLEWWLENLYNYGSLFLGQETTVTYGDKTAGPNHILPTKGAARYTGGLWVGKFLKTVTYQRMTEKATGSVGSVASRISRLEGMEGHALAADLRLEKYALGS